MNRQEERKGEKKREEKSIRWRGRRERIFQVIYRRLSSSCFARGCDYGGHF